MRPILLVLLLLAAPAWAQDPVVDYAPDDPEMQAAIADARGTLDDALDRLEAGAPGVEVALVKVALPVPGGDGHEHIWVALTGRDGDAFEGVLDNEPVHVAGRAGDPIAFDRAMISDWMYVEDERIHGAYTLRAMLPRLDPEEARSWRDALAPLPGE